MWTLSIFFFFSALGTQISNLPETMRAQAAALVSVQEPAAPLAAVVTQSSARTSRHLRKTRRTRAAAVAPKSVVPLLASPPNPQDSGRKIPNQQIAAPSMGIVASLKKVALPPSDALIVLGKVQEFYNNTKSFTAKFSQTVRNSTFGKLRPKVSSGAVYILKPGMMRWDYKNKSRRSKSDVKVTKSFISDATHLWAVMHKNKQFYKQTLDGSALPVAVSFLMGKGDLLKEFDASLDTSGKYGSKSDRLLVLTPKAPSARYKKLWLVIDPVRYSVKQSVVLNSKGDTNSIVFSKVVLNSGKLRKGHFIFNAAAHKDYKLITPPKK